MAILMIHPILALALIWAFMKQRSWRREKEGLRGDERISAVNEHEKSGNRIMVYLILVISVAFIAQIVEAILTGQSNQEALKQLIPNNYHGWAVMALLVIIHAFLGFLYLLQII